MQHLLSDSSNAMPVSHEEITTRFSYHAPKEGQPQLYEALRFEGKTLAMLINESCPDCRETSLALTNLEQAIFWANAAIARRGQCTPT
jgi:hypothetical protein